MTRYKNPLGYSSKGGVWGFKTRHCLTNRERELFIESLAASRINKITIRVYNRYIDEFIRYLNNTHKTTNIRKVSPSMIADYRAYVNGQRTIKEVTKYVKISSIKKWCVWLENNKIIKVSPFRDEEELN